jgi:hypothetical protein
MMYRNQSRLLYSKRRIRLPFRLKLKLIKTLGKRVKNKSSPISSKDKTMKSTKILTHLVALSITPFIAAVALASTPIRIDAVNHGLDLAIANKIVPKDGVLQKGVKQFLKLIIDGSTPEEASNQTGIKLSVIERLQQLGTGQTPAPEPEVQAVANPPVLKVQTVPASKLKPVEQSATKPSVTEPKPQAPVTVARQIETEKEAEQTAQSESDQNQPEQAESLPSGNSKVQADQIWRGLTAVDRNGEIRKYSTQGLAVQKMLQRMRWGDSLAFASQKMGVAKETVFRLLALGTDKPMREDTSAIANALVRGLSKANAIREISYTSSVSYRVQDIVRRLRRGNGLSVSARYSGVSTKTIKRLLELGNYPTNQS